MPTSRWLSGPEIAALVKELGAFDEDPNSKSISLALTRFANLLSHFMACLMEPVINADTQAIVRIDPAQ